MGNYNKKICLLVICLFFVVLSFIPIFNIQAADIATNIPIFCYHRITTNPISEYDLTPAQLESHFQYFKSNGYQTITVGQLLEYQKKPALLPKKTLVLTFDDGTKSHYTEVLPLLKKYGFKGTFYIFPNSTYGSKKRWLSWEEIGELVKAGMDIGSHGLTHPYLTARNGLNEEQYKVWLDKELVQSRKMLEEHLKIQVKTIAYPFGLYDRQVEEAAIKAGYQGMLSINPGPNRIRENSYRLKRRIVVNTMGLKSLANIMADRSLDIQILSPADGEVIPNLPVIRFRVKTPGVSSVRLEVSRYQTVLQPDAKGVYTFAVPKLKRAFYTIITRAKDGNNQSYLNSWSFWYRPLENGQ